MTTDETMVSGDGWISDESDFYGDDQQQKKWESRSTIKSVQAFWAAHPSRPQVIALQARARASQRPTNIDNGDTDPSNAGSLKRSDSKDTMGSLKASNLEVQAKQTTPQPNPAPKFRQPGEGHPLWYQATENLSEFFKRCPPIETIKEETGIDWFWIGNPHVSPEERTMDVDTLCEEGEELKSDYMSKKMKLEEANPNMAPGSITRKLGKDRDDLKQGIADLARETHVVSGKWMLFPKPDDLPRVWKLVCLGVIENRLGPTAKVATTSLVDQSPTHLICVYTKDCFEVDDVRRVLLELESLGLASSGANSGIWYKCDAYTHLGLKSGNEYKLQASLYSSKDMLTRGSTVPKKRASTLDGWTGAKKKTSK